jgi:hypothetical protein
LKGPFGASFFSGAFGASFFSGAFGASGAVVVVGFVQGGLTAGATGVVVVPGVTPTVPTAKRETEAKRRAEAINGVFMVKFILHLLRSKKIPISYP